MELHEDQNTCDRCGRIAYSDELVWVSSEEFTPNEGETVSSEAYEYDALCVRCYEKMLLCPLNHEWNDDGHCKNCPATHCACHA